MRQQGIPVIGTLKYNPNGPIDRDLYIGEPEFGGYEGDVYRTGWTYNYNFDNGWKFTQNAAIQKLQSTELFLLKQAPHLGGKHACLYNVKS
jgi:iron complex outermembrane receptor protein